MSTSPSTPNLLEELRDLSLFFIKAETDMKNGIEVDMSGIDKRVHDVCVAVQTASPNQQEVCLPEMNALLGLLNACELALRGMYTSHETT